MTNCKYCKKDMDDEQHDTSSKYRSTADEDVCNNCIYIKHDCGVMNAVTYLELCQMFSRITQNRSENSMLSDEISMLFELIIQVHPLYNGRKFDFDIQRAIGYERCCVWCLHEHDNSGLSCNHCRKIIDLDGCCISWDSYETLCQNISEMETSSRNECLGLAGQCIEILSSTVPHDRKNGSI